MTSFSSLSLTSSNSLTINQLAWYSSQTDAMIFSRVSHVHVVSRDSNFNIS